VNVRLREEPFDTLYHALDNGAVELALCYELDMPENVEREVLGQFCPYVLLPAGHALAKNDHVSLHDLADQVFILIDLPHSREYFLSLFAQVQALLPSQIQRFRSLETVRGMVANGHGVSILVTRPAGDAAYDGKKLICRPIKERVIPQRTVIGHSTLFPMTRAGRAFVDTCRDYFAKQLASQTASHARKRLTRA
jgi:DNA-binding transcriptional LysR family regulator